MSILWMGITWSEPEIAWVLGALTGLIMQGKDDEVRAELRQFPDDQQALRHTIERVLQVPDAEKLQALIDLANSRGWAK